MAHFAKVEDGIVTQVIVADLWQPPIPQPNDGKAYRWDEQTLAWVEV